MTFPAASKKAIKIRFGRAVAPPTRARRHCYTVLARLHDARRTPQPRLKRIDNVVYDLEATAFTREE